MLDPRNRLQSLKRGLDVLRYLNLRNWATISDIARQFGLARTTAQRILQTLIDEGFVARDAISKKHYLTPAVCSLSAGFDEEDWVVDVATPILRKLTKEVAWPILLAVPFGERMLVRIATDHETSMAIVRFHVGGTVAMAYAPTGLVFLAYCDAPTRNHLLEILARSEDPRQALARTPDVLMRQLKAIQKQGFVNVTYEGMDDFPESSVAVPVMVGGRIFGSILLRYVKKALTPKQIKDVYVPRLREVATEIAVRLEHLNVQDPAGVQRLEPAKR